ncbi:MAG: NAD-dependent malic enzyme, partial [Micrococcales bacterium]|nr:NAD-dependent malic enzyme [Micrococcales bacterium]
RVRMVNRPGSLGRLAVAIGEVGANITGLEGFVVKTSHLEDDLIIYCGSQEHQGQVRAAIEGLDGVELLEWHDRTYEMHAGGKIEVVATSPLQDYDDLAMAYTPGVARVCMEIARDQELSHDYTIRKNTVAIVSDGTAVLGLGDIGPHAAMPVMEGKAMLFKHFAGVDAFPICIDTKDPSEIVDFVRKLAPSFGGINLEDIAAPGAFEVEERLIEALDIPVFHDDQHGTAIVTVAALQNALTLVGKRHEDVKVVVAGVGAAGVAVSKMLLAAGVRNIVGVDRMGAVHTGRSDLNASKQWFAGNTNPDRLAGTITDVIAGADVFIGLAGPDLLTVPDVRSMSGDPIVFAMANPNPEIRPELIQDIAAVIATGRSDFPNQINNVLAFPGMFRGAFDAKARRITENMKLAAAQAIAAVVGDGARPDYIVPSAFDERVAPAVAAATAQAAREDGVCRP